MLERRQEGAEKQEGTAVRVSIRNLSKIYRTRRGEHVALDNVSLEIGADEFVVLLGPSGCGKTTLLRCIAGLEEPDAGQIYINGQLVFCSESGVFVPPEKRQLNMVFQSYALWPHLKISENVAYPLKNGGVNTRDAHARAQEALELVGLGTYGAAYPGQLSGGQQQRVALARAIVSGDGLVLFDEPLSNLDAKVRERLRIELLNLQARIGFSAVYVTHDQVEALALADRVAVMNVGQIAQTGTPMDIYDRPRTRYVADFVGSANEIEAEIVEAGDTLAVSTPIGALKGVVGGTPLKSGDKAWVMFRPEHCSFVDASRAAETNVVSGELTHSFYLGAVVQHVIRCGDHDIVVSQSGQAPREIGQQVHICCPLEKVRIFEAGGSE